MSPTRKDKGGGSACCPDNRYKYTECEMCGNKKLMSDVIDVYRTQLLSNIASEVEKLPWVTGTNIFIGSEQIKAISKDDVLSILKEV